MKKDSLAPMQNKLYGLYTAGIFLILLLPLFNLPPWFAPPDWGKTIVFRVVFSILLCLFVLQLLDPSQRRVIASVARQRIASVKTGLGALLLLLFVFLLATIFSLDPYFSTWGSPYRAGGFVNFALYFLFAIFLFLVVRPPDWKKIWIFSFAVGFCVSIIALFQQWGLFKEILVTTTDRPPSTIGGPTFLATYLILLTFLSFSFGLSRIRTWLQNQPQNRKNLALAFLGVVVAIVFVFIIVFTTRTRAAILGLAAGFFYFGFLYPFQRRGLFLAFKILSLLILLTLIGSVYAINIQQKLPTFIQDNKILSGVASRFLFKNFQETEPRIAAWKVSWQALKARPLLGYGPENFAIGFDKYYDPTSPKLQRSPDAPNSWWDRAHNFFFDVSLQSGIVGFIAYLLLLVVLFWKLHGVKRLGSPNAKIIAHGIQATFIGYLVTDIFDFDTFSIYLIFFLQVAYALALIAEYAPSVARTTAQETGAARPTRSPSGMRAAGQVILVIALFWFLWAYNIKPLQINTQINLADYFVEHKQCDQALNRMDTLLNKKSFLDSYVRLKYADSIKNCDADHPENRFAYAQKGYEFLKENLQKQPYYTRNWILAGGFINVLIEKNSDALQQTTDIAEKKKLVDEIKRLTDEANQYFKKAVELSPKRQETYIEWIKTGIVSGDYDGARQRAQQCILLNPQMGDCYWGMALTEVFAGNQEQFAQYQKLALANSYPVESLTSLNQLAKAYSQNKNYKELAATYEKLIQLKPQEIQYHASLAFTYRELGEYDLARREALKVLELQPETKTEVEQFLQTLH